MNRFSLTMAMPWADLPKPKGVIEMQVNLTHGQGGVTVWIEVLDMGPDGYDLRTIRLPIDEDGHCVSIDKYAPCFDYLAAGIDKWVLEGGIAEHGEDE
jgi:hypothetical protein